MLQRRFALLGQLRKQRLSMQMGNLRWLCAQGHVLVFAREWEGERTVAAINVGQESESLSIRWDGLIATDALTGQQFHAVRGGLEVCLPPMDAMLLI